ncbi:gliding motility-associated C-terminal domain-containing protein [Pedobacter sp. HCMS5-2]|uniref:Gliding motility-associated C-terminal domain-containing protein n=2 Tax=Pedobacter punctiformis TaxID=3004097 RepID=A0ABT4L7T6_9SPHI|nr:gliding motility-associated C-terminal domain-containing protein [Pedobacter sp. HCMS5-2]
MTITAKLYAQACPENIGFENGNFQNWKLYTGTTSNTDNKNFVYSNEVAAPIIGRHTIISNKTATDPYGHFPLIPSGGGNFSVKLGDDGAGSQSEGISFLINVPSDRPDFTLTYQYAVVLEDPAHKPAEQPRFIARVKDVEKNEYIPCASFEYIATSSLPGFKRSDMSNLVIYKEWTPVTINLSGYQGKKLIVEFISADCTLSGHFGYAYVDVNNLCGDIIVGNTYCKSADQLTVSGPSGFKTYNWYNEDRTVKYASSQSAVIKPTPPEGSKILLDLIPFDGFGCPSTVFATVKSVNYQIEVVQKRIVCKDTEIDLTSTDYILNKTPDFTYLVYEDKDLTKEIKGLAKITEDKTYYLLATNYKGCESVAIIDLKVNNLAAITAKNPDPVCYTETVDITGNSLLTGDLTGITKSFFTDAAMLKPLADPAHVNKSGIYYIKLNNNTGCDAVVPVTVQISAKPLLKITNPAAVCFPSKVDITKPANFNGSDADFKYSFFADNNLSQPIADPKNIDKTGIYYVKAENAKGCVVSDKINVTINELPLLTINDPAAVCYPEKVDITNSVLYSGSSANVTYTYFYDAALTNKINNPKQIDKTGTYYTKITNSSGCFISDKINVVINPLPIIVLNQPAAIFDSEFIDLTSASIIQGSKGYAKVSYFQDAALLNPLSNPAKINKAGQYYIRLENDKGCSVSSSIELKILPTPKIIVPTAFTPQKATNNRLYPFLVSITKLTSFKVFNKWGILVYQTNDLDAGWDGRFRSKMQPLETFSWVAEGIDSFGGKFQSQGKTILIL